nr:transcriptional regulator sdnM-like [Quercus suber]POF15533.1 hypothetical protein CFP56_48728 [Quercus suber]
MGIFSRKEEPAAPATVPTDTVYPMHYFDDQFVGRALVLHFTYRFDDVLDADKIRLALANGKLEHHIPERYSVDRPGFRYSCINTGISIEDHYIARHLPKAGPDPVVFQNSDRFQSLLKHDHTPTKLEDWIFSDAPPLSLNIVTFTDATLLTLSWSHVFLDAVGRTTLFKAWLAVLDGREADVPPFVGYETDPFDALDGKTAPEKYVFYDAMLTGLSFALFVAYMILEFVFHPKQANRTVFLPAALIQALRSQAMEDLTVNADTDPDSRPFVSEGDVILAWWARVNAVALQLSLAQPINIMNVMNFRGILDDVLPPDQAFIGNATGVIYTQTTVKKLLEEPLGSTAMSIRRSLEQQKTQEQVEAYVSLHKSVMRESGRGPVVGPANQQMITLSNWHRARFFEYDWSSAVVKPGRHLNSRKNKVGRASYIHVHGNENGFSVRNGGGLIGKDAGGNFWMTWAVREEVWPLLEAEIKKWQARLV